MNLIEKIRTRSREEYQDLAREQLTQLRIWLQEHGELALLIGLVGGIVVVEAFQLITFLVMAAAIVGLGIWLIALPKVPAAPRPSAGPGSNGHAASSSTAPRDQDPTDKVN